MGDKNENSTSNDDTLSHRWIWFVTGPTACGKTTIAKFLAQQLDFTFLEGDDFHPKANVEKMSRGEGLTDADRWAWLDALRDHESMHPPDQASQHLVITCSALKREYRDVLREGSKRSPDLDIHFVHLDAPESVLYGRAVARKGHYAGGNLVHSQFDAMDTPGEDEKDVICIDVNRPTEEAEQAVLKKVKEIMAAYKE